MIGYYEEENPTGAKLFIFYFFVLRLILIDIYLRQLFISIIITKLYDEIWN